MSNGNKKDFSTDTKFLGHPMGVGTTSTMQAMTAFSGYGMSAILVYFLYATLQEGGLGFEKGLAAQLTSIYTAMATIAGVVGAYVADRFLGLRKSLLIGWILKTLGFFMLAIPNGGVTFYVANQCLLIMAAAFAGQSLYAMVGKMYSPTETRRDGAFTIMYVMNNVGVISPMITGAFAARNLYYLGFGVSAVASLIGLIVYLFSQKHFGDAGILPDDPVLPELKKKMLFKTFGTLISLMGIVVFLLAKGRLTPKAFVNFVSILSIFAPFGYLLYIGTSKKTTPKEKKKIIPFAALFVCNCFTLMIWGQAVSILLVFAEERVNNSLMGISFAPAAWITISSFFSILFGTLTGSIWTKLGNKQPSTASKFGMGTIFYGLASMFMAVPIILYPGNVKIMGLWILIFFIILIFGESISSPIGLGFATAVSPKAFTAQMVTVWQLGLSTGAGVASLSINFYTQGQEATFFLASGLITIIVGASLLLIRKPIMKIAAE